jgi:hypothetical protein
MLQDESFAVQQMLMWVMKIVSVNFINFKWSGISNK